MGVRNIVRGVNGLARSVIFPVHRKIRTHATSGALRRLAAEAGDAGQLYAALPRLPVLVPVGGDVPRTLLEMMCYQLPEAVPLRRCLGDGALRAYFAVLRHTAYTRAGRGLFRRVASSSWLLPPLGEFIVASQGRLIGFSLADRIVRHRFLVAAEAFQKQELAVREKLGECAPRFLGRRPGGYDEEFAMPDESLAETISRLGQDGFVEQAVTTCLGAYQALPIRDVSVAEWVEKLAGDIADSPQDLPLSGACRDALPGLCRRLATNETYRLCTIHGDLKLDQFLVSNGRLLVIDWELARPGFVEHDWVQLLSGLDDLANMLRSPERYDATYRVHYDRLKAGLGCHVRLPLPTQVALFLLEQVALTSRMAETFSCDPADVEFYTNRRVENLLPLLEEASASGGGQRR